MKITTVRATPVRVPRLTRFLPRTAHGEVTASEYVILELGTDNGAVGLAEVTCSPTWSGEDAAGSTELLEGDVGSRLVGTDPANWNRLAAAIDPLLEGRPFLRAAIEMACLDLTGKRLGASVADLLGGPVRERIPTKLVLPARATDLVMEMARDAAGLGPSTLKVKVGLDVGEDIERVAAVRREVGEAMQLTVDANEGWREEDAKVGVAALTKLGVAAFEQPLPRGADSESAGLREMTAAAIVGDESIWTLEDVAAAWRAGSFDTVSVYPGKCGGLRRCLRMARTALDLGLEVTFGSNLELGIGAAALAQVAAVCPRLSTAMPADLIGPLYFESTLVADASFVGWTGARLPAGPGLGIELDREALARYAFSPSANPGRPSSA